jgi:adenylate cyclase, class 2
MLEIELKVRVPDLETVRSCLGTLHARLSEKTHEHDVYYNAPHRDFSSTDEALRVRYSSGRVVVTYKGAKRRDLAMKARDEINVTVGSGVDFERMLQVIGFTRTATVDKQREYYLYRDTVIALDEVEDLGVFVEIEGSGEGKPEAITEHIRNVAEEIGVRGEHISSSYLEMILATR